jgi:hypothetical protein
MCANPDKSIPGIVLDALVDALRGGVSGLLQKVEGILSWRPRMVHKVN